MRQEKTQYSPLNLSGYSGAKEPAYITYIKNTLYDLERTNINDLTYKEYRTLCQKLVYIRFKIDGELQSFLQEISTDIKCFIYNEDEINENLPGLNQRYISYAKNMLEDADGLDTFNVDLPNADEAFMKNYRTILKRLIYIRFNIDRTERIYWETLANTIQEYINALEPTEPTQT